jgi:hypothetical protein
MSEEQLIQVLKTPWQAPIATCDNQLYYKYDGIEMQIGANTIEVNFMWKGKAVQKLTAGSRIHVGDTLTISADGFSLLVIDQEVT